MNPIVEELRAGGIAPPREHLELGDHVRYHHRACVARLKRPEHGPPFWLPCGEGRPDLPLNWMFGPDGFTTGPDPFGVRVDHDVNKTIICWPQEGGGMIVGMVRRGIGISVKASSYNTMDGWDHDPGYFDTKEWHWLYAIKSHLSGLAVVLAPMWATTKEAER